MPVDTFDHDAASRRLWRLRGGRGRGVDLDGGDPPTLKKPPDMRKVMGGDPIPAEATLGDQDDAIRAAGSIQLLEPA